MLRSVSSARCLFGSRASFWKIKSCHMPYEFPRAVSQYQHSRQYTDSCGRRKLFTTGQSGVQPAIGGTYPCKLRGHKDKHGGILVDLDTELAPECTPAQFKEILEDSMRCWRDDAVTAVWLRLSVNMSHLISVAADQGYIFHHAENQHAVMYQWLSQSMNRIPRFATHQVGVAGCVVWEDESKVLMVRDKHSKVKLWKFPGGLSELGENMGDTAVREVFEETGVKTKFCGILALRQQHDQPGAFGRSDLYIICHLTPLTFEIHRCHTEIEACQWMHLKQLENAADNSAVTLQIALLVRHGLEHGFEDVNISSTEYKSVFTGRKFNLYSRQLKQGIIKSYKHSLT